MLRARDNITVLPAKSDFEVSAIPFQDGSEFDSLEQYAGQIPMQSAKDVMFFWLISNTTNTQNKDKFILWLNGGPGCTSLDGVFMENGPYKFDGGNRLGFRDHSLTQQFDVLYIDQPFGTGFSVADIKNYAHSFKEATTFLLDFLRKFYEIFPEFREKQLYVAGESEAGTYIPYLADGVLKMPKDERFNLGGLMIGNGWVDPLPMYMSYVDVLKERDLLSADVEKSMLELMDKCAREFSRAPQPVHTDICERIPQVFLDQGGPSPGICYNMYDLRLTDTQPSCGMNWPPEVGFYTEYLNRRDVQNALNVDPKLSPAVWKECSSAPNAMLRSDNSPPSVLLLDNILDHIPVLFFVGQMDYLCNYIGTEWTIGNMTWAGATGFSDSVQAADWTILDKTVGRVQSDRGLTYALINDASHMIGVDKPREILDLFTAFTNSTSDNLSFSSSLRSVIVSDEMKNSPSPVTAPSGQLESAHWVGFAFFFMLVVSFLLCFFVRRRIFDWWITRRSHQYSGSSGRGAQRLEEELVARGGALDGMDDAFVMSDFSFAKQGQSNNSLDLDGLLLDDGMASSPDEEYEAASTFAGSSSHSRSPAH
ncbi:Cell death protease [Kickxella alabastrina]|uniref:Cell death protease n=1 Tax=Kickxella alabastrina TaxID=61397 RepID=A0ACC1I689_9FUNG|nr:Cell death protease [Kickxella alabastrina]